MPIYGLFLLPKNLLLIAYIRDLLLWIGWGRMLCCYLFVTLLSNTRSGLPVRRDWLGEGGPGRPLPNAGQDPQGRVASARRLDWSGNRRSGSPPWSRAGRLGSPGPGRPLPKAGRPGSPGPGRPPGQELAGQEAQGRVAPLVKSWPVSRLG
jgi:hypothetical protein